MKAEIKKASDWNYIEERTFNTLEELMAFIRIVGSVIIHYGYNPITEEYDILTITIYDDYIE